MNSPWSRPSRDAVGFFLVAAVLCLLSACANTPSGEEATPAEPPPPDYARGARLYQAYCAGCHDSGKLDAPMLDDSEDWDERSLQWDAILRHHAAAGFLNMPPRGDHPELSEPRMNDILFFMLTRIRALDE